MNRRAPEELLLPTPRANAKACVDEPRRVVVAGGGLAGVAAATILAERGVDVVVVEKEPFLGGRAAAWTDQLQSGESFEMERGFHAFFRQYYNLRSFLRRIDPELSFLEPMTDYPILGPNGESQSFAGLPSRAPWNIVALTRRTPTIGMRDLLRINRKAAMQMLCYEPTKTYARFDNETAASYLDSLRFPEAARRMLFDVFAHSFFNPEEKMSAGELLMMFHFYFAGNPEGLVFDIVRAPFSTAIWDPMRKYLEGLGVDIRTGCAVQCVAQSGTRWQVKLDGSTEECDGVVLALNVPALRNVVANSPDLEHEHFTRSIASLQLTEPFVVWRLWLDRPAAEGRFAFVGTTGVGALDNISLYHLFEDESRDWAARTGGSVVELHAYAVPEQRTEAEIRADLMAGFHHFYPEYEGATVIEERYLHHRDCPAFAPNSHASRPGVTTPHAGVVLAGDFVRLPVPSALMERAVTSGFLAANHLLARDGVRPEPIRSVPRLGLFARRQRVREQAAIQAGAV